MARLPRCRRRTCLSSRRRDFSLPPWAEQPLARLMGPMTAADLVTSQPDERNRTERDRAWRLRASLATEALWLRWGDRRERNASQGQEPQCKQLWTLFIGSCHGADHPQSRWAYDWSNRQRTALHLERSKYVTALARVVAMPWWSASRAAVPSGTNAFDTASGRCSARCVGGDATQANI